MQSYSCRVRLPGQVKTGCQKTPDFKSRYCPLQKPRACSLSQIPCENESTQDGAQQPVEGIVQAVLETTSTRHNANYKVLHGYVTFFIDL